MTIFSNGVMDNVIDALSSTSLWTAVIKSVAIILLGFFLTKGGIFGKEMPKVLTKIVLVLALPCLAFTGFMSNVTAASFQAAILSFFWGFIIYTIFIFLAKLIFCKFDPTRRKVLEICFVFGSTTFFGQPLISAIFPAATSEGNMFNIAYRVFLYSYAFIVIANSQPKAPEMADGEVLMEVKEDGTVAAPTESTSKVNVDVKDILKKIFLNPIVIATLVGFFLWSMQLAFENVSWVKVNVGTEAEPSLFCFWRTDQVVPYIHGTLTTLGGLASPLVWLAIGGTLATISFKEAAKDKTAWIYSVLKIFGAPIVNLLLLLLLNLFIDVNFTLIAATTLMWATPPATVAVSYCISFDREALLASNCSFLGTFVAVIGIPFWIIILTVIQSAGIFA